MKRRSSPIRSRISEGGRDQFSELKEKIVRMANAEIAGRAHGAAQRLDAAPMAFDARQAARGGPAAVAVHDDGDVPRHGEASPHRNGRRRFAFDRRQRAHTVMISFSLAASSLSISAIICVGRLLHLARTGASCSSSLIL